MVVTDTNTGDDGNEEDYDSFEFDYGKVMMTTMTTTRRIRRGGNLNPDF